MHRSLTTAIVAAAALAVPATASAATPAVSPVPPSDDPVNVEVTITDGAGTAVQTQSCEWRGEGPGDEDRLCLAFVGDPKAAVDAITAAGGERGTRRTVAPAHALDMTSVTSRRADGTWLQRITGTAKGQATHAGFVCDSAGERCTRWDAEGEPRAKKQIQAAALRLKRRGR